MELSRDGGTMRSLELASNSSGTQTAPTTRRTTSELWIIANRIAEIVSWADFRWCSFSSVQLACAAVPSILLGRVI